MKLGVLPRIRLANLPTPLQELPNLSKALDGPKIFVKRDDLTGLAFGGNKTRKLEYLMADAISKGADHIVTGAGIHSNWCTQTAAAARRLGMKAVLVKSGPSDGYDPREYDGNHLLHFILGAEIKVARPENTEKIVRETMEELRRAGHTPYHMRDAGSTPPGVAGYMNAILEITSQAVEMGIHIDYLVHATGSGGTQAGLIIGANAFNTGMKIIGVTVGNTPKKDQIEKISKIVDESLGFLDLPIEIGGEELIVYDGYAGGGYGFMNEGKAEAVKVLAETEGLLIDPVYTSCSMGCLIDLCRKGFFKKDDVVAFLHTGGSAALFPYKGPIKAYALKEKPPWVIPPWSPSAG